MQIVERDINSYTGFVEKADSDLRNCSPKDESKYRKRCIAYKNVLISLQTLKSLINEE